MNIREKARYDMFIRVIEYLLESAGDFPAGSVGAIQLAVLQGVVQKVNTLSGQQTAGFGDARFAFVGKDTARENLREDLSDIADTARSMMYEFPGINKKFPAPRNLGDLDLLALGRAVETEAPPYQADFIRYELDKNFLADLQTDIAALEQSLSAPADATDEMVAATAEIASEVRKGMVAVRILKGVIRNKYKGNVGKRAAWTSASHIEKHTPVPNTPPTPPTP